MIDPKNMTIQTGNLVATPEKVSDNILTMRIAIDNACFEGGERKAGFFNIKVFLNGIDSNHRDFLERQIEKENLTAGSRITVTGSLCQERWADQDGNKRQNVAIIAHQVDYAGGGKAESDGSLSKKANTSSETVSEEKSFSLPDSF